VTLGLHAQAIRGALALAAWASGAAAQQAPAQLNTMKDMGTALQACWIPPPIEQARPGMQITVMMSFKRDGALLGQPRITFESAGATDDEGWPTGSRWPKCSSAVRRCRSPRSSATRWRAGRSRCDSATIENSRKQRESHDH